MLERLYQEDTEALKRERTAQTVVTAVLSVGLQRIVATTAKHESVARHATAWIFTLDTAPAHRGSQDQS